jgi:amino acid permease
MSEKENFEIIDQLEDEQEDRNPLYKSVIILLIFLGFCFLFYLFFFSRDQGNLPLNSDNLIPSVKQDCKYGSQDKRTLFINKSQDCG